MSENASTFEDAIKLHYEKLMLSYSYRKRLEEETKDCSAFTRQVLFLPLLELGYTLNTENNNE